MSKEMKEGGGVRDKGVGKMNDRKSGNKNRGQREHGMTGENHKAR